MATCLIKLFKQTTTLHFKIDKQTLLIPCKQFKRVRLYVLGPKDASLKIYYTVYQTAANVT